MEYLSPVLSTGDDKESSESPVLSTEFIKQNKNRIFNLYEAALKITYTAPNSDVVKGTIDLKNVHHIYFDTDNRFDTLTSSKTKGRLKKRCTFTIDISSRKYKLTPTTENDMRLWLRTLLRINVLHNKITERTITLRGSLKSISGLELEKSFGIPHIYDRILELEEEEENEERKSNLFVHIHDLTHDDIPLKYNICSNNSINKLIEETINTLKPKDSEEEEKKDALKMTQENYDNLCAEVFQIKLLVNGKRYKDDLASAWKSEEWFETGEFHVPKVRHLDLSFQSKITPLAKLVLKNKIGTEAAQNGGVYIELVPLYLIPQLQISIKINNVQLLRDDATNKQFAMYRINVQNGGLRWIASHRYSEFHVFHTSLVELWAQRGTPNGIKAIPQLPPKTFSKTFDIVFLDQRRRELEKFIKDLLNHEWASQRPEVLSFLGQYYHFCPQ
jgi:hypothetical protein